MGPSKYRGIGSGATTAAPASPESGSGGGGSLRVGRVNLSPAVSELGDVTTGRITLAMLDFTILAMIGFYVWTHSAQGGA